MAVRRTEQSEYALGRLLAFKEFPSSGGVARSAGVVPLSFNPVLKERTKALRKAGLLPEALVEGVPAFLAVRPPRPSGTPPREGNQ